MVTMDYEKGLREYLVILNIPEYIIKDVQKFKSEFRNTFGYARYLESKAHISLCYFEIVSTPEQSIQKELQNYFKDWRAFKVTISGFNHFAGSRTLFLSPSGKEIIKLQNHLRTVLRQRIKIGKKYTQAIRKPHITIASNISSDTFAKGLIYYSDKHYNQNFIANGITILRKNRSYNEEHYKIAFNLEFCDDQ